MGRAGLEPALLYQELGPKPSAYANFATCPLGFSGLWVKVLKMIAFSTNLFVLEK
jgi:hypothetical protein